MAGRPVSANADGDAAFGPLGTGQPPEWSVTGRPAQEGDEDRSTWLTGRFELGRNDTRAVLRRTLMSSSADRGHRPERPGAPRRLARPRHQGHVRTMAASRVASTYRGSTSAMNRSIRSPKPSAAPNHTLR